MLRVITEHEIHPVIAKTFEFEEATEAFEYLKAQSAVGKVVIKC